MSGRKSSQYSRTTELDWEVPGCRQDRKHGGNSIKNPDFSHSEVERAVHGTKNKEADGEHSHDNHSDGPVTADADS